MALPGAEAMVGFVRQKVRNGMLIVGTAMRAWEEKPWFTDHCCRSGFYFHGVGWNCKIAAMASLYYTIQV
jgi:hypothetical protein